MKTKEKYFIITTDGAVDTQLKTNNCSEDYVEYEEFQAVIIIDWVKAKSKEEAIGKGKVILRKMEYSKNIEIKATETLPDKYEKNLYE